MSAWAWGISSNFDRRSGLAWTSRSMAASSVSPDAGCSSSAKARWIDARAGEIGRGPR